MKQNTQETNIALAILVQIADRAIERGGLNRKQVLEIDWAIKTLTEPEPLGRGPREEIEVSKDTNHKEKEKNN